MVDATPVAGPSKPNKRHGLKERKAFRQARKQQNEKLKPSSKGKEKALEEDVEQWPYIALSAARASECPVLYSADGSLCFVPDTSTVKVYRSSTAQLLSTLRPEGTSEVTALLLNPSNTLQLHVASSDGKIGTWDYLEGKQIRSLDLGHSIHFMCSSLEQPHCLYYVAREETVSFEKGKGRTSRSSDRVFCATLHKNGTAVSGQPRLIGKLSRVTGLALTFDAAYLIATCSRSGGIHIASTDTLNAGFITLEAGHPFTALATHPSERSFATGDQKGRIHVWYPFDDAFLVLAKDAKKRVVASQIFHWHAHAVASLVYMPNGAYLASGGEESVLVLWQLASGHREYLPRLGAPICSISLSSSGHEFAIALADASVLFVDAQSLTVRRSIASVKIDTTEARHAVKALAAQPGTNALVLNSSHPSSLQFFSPTTSSHMLDLEVSPAARFSKTDDVPIEPARVERVAFSPKGNTWMATIDSWKAQHYTEESYLKIWRYEANEERWVLDTRIDHPHGHHRIAGMAFASSTSNESLLATCGGDGQIRVWQLSTTSNGWRCRSALAHRDLLPCDLAWSADGSLLAVAYRSSIVLFSVSLARTQAVASFACSQLSPVTHVAFAGARGDLLVAAGENGVTAWDVVTESEHLHLACRASLLLARPGLDKMIALETLAANEHRLKPRTSAFIVDLQTGAVELKQLPLSIRQAVFLDGATSEDVAVAVITSEGGLGLAGDGARAAPTVSAVPINAAASLQARTLFDDLFGRSTQTEPAMTEAKARGKTEKLAQSDLFEAPSHVLPPLSTIWRSLLPLPAKKEVLQQGVNYKSTEDAMQVDEPAPQAEEEGPAKLSVYEHDLGKLLNGLKM